jgi:hypothetical protein
VAPQRPDSARQFRSVGGLLRRLLGSVSDAQPSTTIEVTERDALAFEVADIPRQTRQSAAVWRKRQYLRTDVRAEPLPLDPVRVAVLRYRRRAPSQSIPNL